jgi:osmoprotectant transport system permease protein
MANDLARVLAALLDSPMAQRTWVHAGWVACAISFALPVAVGVGVLASQSPALERALRRVCDSVSSVPALAWLGLCIALLDKHSAIPCFLAICTAPALGRGVLDGIRAVDPQLMDLAVALGLSGVARTRMIAAPMASPAILLGLRDATTHASAATTVAAIAGAGGYGELIIDGVVAGDPARMLAGAVAATAFTLAVRAAIAALGRLLPPG